jgi:hypothetical protein
MVGYTPAHRIGSENGSAAMRSLITESWSSRRKGNPVTRHALPLNVRVLSSNIICDHLLLTLPARRATALLHHGKNIRGDAVVAQRAQVNRRNSARTSGRKTSTHGTHRVSANRHGRRHEWPEAGHALALKKVMNKMNSDVTMRKGARKTNGAVGTASRSSKTALNAA